MQAFPTNWEWWIAFCKFANSYLLILLASSESCQIMGKTRAKMEITSFSKVFYCAFQNNIETLLNQQLHFSLPSIIFVDVSGNRSSLQQVQKVGSVGCDW